MVEVVGATMPDPYDIKHQRNREKLLRDLRALWVRIDAGSGEPPPICPECGGVMRPWEPLHCGHSTFARKAAGLPGDRLEHGSCNMSAGAHHRHGPQHPTGYTPSQRW